MSNLHEEFRSWSDIERFLPDSLQPTEAPAARDYVDDGRRPWRGELLLVVYEAGPKPTEPNRCAFRAASAIELLAGYLHTRSEFLVKGSDQQGQPSTSRTELILAGDFLQGLAFETLGSMECSDTVVQRCFETATRTVESVVRESFTSEPTSSHELVRTPDSATDPTFASQPSAKLGALATDLGRILGGHGPTDSEQLRATGAIVGMAIKNERDHRMEAPTLDPTPRSQTTHGNSPDLETPDTYWESAQDIVARIEPAAFRCRLRAFLESLSTGLEQ
jgi:geranylgeranyl pyrophosphate synthase